MNRGAAVMALGLLAGCGLSVEEVQRVVGKQGFTDIEATGYEPFVCAEDDSFSEGFRAKNSRGQLVTGVVCCGLFKRCTVRF